MLKLAAGGILASRPTTNMIGNPYKADLIKDRIHTLELMKDLAHKYKQMPSGDVRDGIEAAIVELGAVSKRYAVMIDSAEPMPEKWVNYYKIMQKLESHGNSNK